MIFFSLWFHLINLYCPRIGINENNQGIADAKKIKRADGVNEIDIADKADRAERTNRADKTRGVDGGDRVNRADVVNGLDRVDRVRIVRGGADTKKSDGIDRGGIDVEQSERAAGGRVDEGRANKGRVDVEKLDELAIAAGKSSLKDPQVEKQRVAK